LLVAWNEIAHVVRGQGFRHRCDQGTHLPASRWWLPRTERSPVVTSLTAFCMVCSGAYRPGVSVSLPAVNRVGPSWKMS